MGFHQLRDDYIYRKTGFKFVSTAMIDFAHIYGEIVYVFRNIIRNDISDVISIKHEHINSRMAIRKKLMKSPKKLLQKNKPVLDINTSLENDFQDDVFSPLAFNTDLSHIISIDKMADTFIRGFDKEDPKKNIEASFTFKRIKLNIEANVIEDFRQKLLNLFQYWKSTRYPNRLYRKNIILSFPVPQEIYLEYCRSYDLDYKDKYEVYRHMKRLTPFPLEFKKNLSTGNEDIFLQYETYMDFTPDINNLSDGQLNGSIRNNFRLTRSFEVVVTVPSICFLKLNRESIRKLQDESDVPFPRLEEPENEMIVDTQFKLWQPFNWSDEKEKEYQKVVESGYEFSAAEEIIDLKELLFDEFKEFYHWLYDHEEHLVSDYIDIKYFKDTEPNEDKTFLIDREKLLIDEKEADQNALYRVVVYVKLDYFNDWLKNRGYEEIDK